MHGEGDIAYGFTVQRELDDVAAGGGERQPLEVEREGRELLLAAAQRRRAADVGLYGAADIVRRCPAPTRPGR